MKITKRQLKRLIETAAGRKAARASMNKNIRSSQGHDVDFEDWLQDTYSDIDDYFDGGYDEDAGSYGQGAWVVYDEVEGRFVDSGVKEKSPIGKLKAYHAVNSREAMNFKGQQIAAGMMENKTKITRRQLRKIIKEALDGNADQQEAAYAVAYTNGYLSASDADFGEALRKNPQLAEEGDAWVPLDAALGNIHSVMVTGMSSIKRENPRIQLPEEGSIFQEGQAAGQADFRESIYKYIEQVEALVNRQTPMGMSAAEGLGVFGIEGGGVLYKDTAAEDARALIALMDDDNVLGWLDRLESEGIK